MSFPVPEKNSCIYLLKCPITGLPKYIGLTTIGVARIKLHWRDVRPNKSGKLIKIKAWIKSLKKKGLVFKVEYIDYANTNEELIEKEIYWIDYYRKSGYDLLNHSDGGYLPLNRKLTEEQKLEISRKTKIAMYRPDVRQRYLEGNKNKTVPKRYKPRSMESRIVNSNTEYAKRLKVKISSEFGEEFDSIKQLAKLLDISSTYISYCLKNNKKIRGVSYKITKDSVLKHKTKPKCKPLYDNLGNTYENQKEACLALNKSMRTVGRMLKENRSDNNGVRLFYGPKCSS